MPSLIFARESNLFIHLCAGVPIGAKYKILISIRAITLKLGASQIQDTENVVLVTNKKENN